MDVIFLRKNPNENPDYLAGLLLIYLMRPYFTWTGFLASNYTKALACLIIGLLFLKHKDRTQESRILLFLFLVISIMYIYTSGLNYNSLLLFVPLTFLPFSVKSYMKNCFDGFLNIYTIFLCLSLVVWLFMVVGLLHPYTTIEPLNDVKLYNYNVYPLLVQSNDPFHPENWFRFHGIFDEPGVIGTISGLLLCIKNFDFRDFRCIILLISGLCTVSLFFFVLVAIYASVFYALGKRKYMQTFGFLAFAILTYYLTQTIPELYDVIGNRFEWNPDTGSFSGDNRISEVGMLYFLSSIGTPEFWFGVVNKKAYIDMTEGSSSIINVIMFNGMVFLLCYVTFFFIYAFTRKNNIISFVLFLFVFFATLYQRPNVFSAEYIFLWSCLACFGGTKENIKLNSCR